MAPSPDPLRHCFTLRIDLAEVARARRLISELAAEAGFPEQRRFDIQVASSEACANAIEHSSPGSEVVLEVLTYQDRLEVKIDGAGQFEIPAVAATERTHRGLGLPLMAKLSDHFALYSGPRGGTLVALTFYRPGFRDEHPDDVTPPSIVELVQENELVTAILGSITDEVWFADTQKRFTLANAAAIAEFGTATSEGTAVAELAAATEVYRADMTLRPVEEAPPLRALAGEVVKNQEEVVRTPGSAGLRHRLVNAAPVRDASGEIVGAVSVVRDITQRKEAEERYRDLFNTLIEGFCIIEVVFDEAENPIDYRFLETNPSFEEQTGLHDVQGRLIRELAPDNDEYWYQIYGKVALTGEPARFHAPSTPLGRTYDVSAFRVGWPSSRQVGILFNDVTKRKQTEEQMRRQLDALAQISDAVIATDLEFRITSWNKAAESMYGWPAEEAVGRVMSECVPTEYAEEEREKVTEMFWRDGSWHGEVVQTRRDTTKLAILSSVVISRDSDENPTGVLAVNRDITARRQSQEDLRESERRYSVLFNNEINGMAHCRVITDENGAAVDYWILRINDAYERVIGIKKADIEGRRVTQVFPDIKTYAFDYIGAYGKIALEGGELKFEEFFEATGQYLEIYAYCPLPGEFAAVFTDVTERKQAEEALRKSESSLAEAQRIGRIGSWEWNIQTGEVSWSAELYSIYQVDPDTFVPSIQAFGDYIHPDDRGQVDGIIGQILSGSAPGSFDFRIVLADGSTHYLNTTGQITEYDEAGRPRLMVGVNQDITERKRAEQTLLRLNRTLAAHSASDQALIRATDESSYLTEVCRIVVEDCGHAMVWIGYKEEDDDKSIRPVASAGFEEGYLETLKITWADGERGRGPTGTAVRTGRPSKCRNMLTDPAFAPWREEAVRRGYASSVSLPLLQNGIAFGAIMIYSSEPDPFSDDEVKLLADLTDDLALGITTLRLRTAHAEAERERDILLVEEQQLAEELQAINEELQTQTEELQTQTEELAARERQLREQNTELRASRYNRTLIEASLDPFVTIGLDGTITDVNEATVKITGYTREALIGTDFSTYFTAPESARSGYRKVFANGLVTDYPLTIRARDGKLTDVLYNATVYKDEQGAVLGVFAAARDMTAIKELEKQREIAGVLQKALLDLPQRAPGVEFGHLYHSATQQAQVGGDFYDVFDAKGGRIAVLIGDVSGHGVEAARSATLVKDIVHAFAHQFRRPYLVLREINRLLVEKNLPGFVTAFLGFLDPANGALVYSSAGHPPPLLSAEGQVEPLNSAGMPLGVFADTHYRDTETEIRKRKRPSVLYRRHHRGAPGWRSVWGAEVSGSARADARRTD